MQQSLATRQFFYDVARIKFYKRLQENSVLLFLMIGYLHDKIFRIESFMCVLYVVRIFNLLNPGFILTISVTLHQVGTPFHKYLNK